MSKGATIEVDSDLIKWARESAGLSVPEAAKKVGVKPDKFQEWEGTAGRPTARQLERLADAVKRPVAAFFLPARPAEPEAPLDFRVAPGSARPELSTVVRLTIRRARRVLRIYRELGGEERPAAVALTRAEPVEAGAARAREALHVSTQEQATWGSAKVALEQWRARLEGLGVLVLQFNMAHESVSGFSLSEGEPTIVLNKSDHESRRCFTLFHEWAHLLLGEPGLCAVDEGRVAQAGEVVETFCNAFAAEVLAPLRAVREADFATDLLRKRLALDAAVAQGVSRFCVSRWVILVRLLSAQLIDREQFTRVVVRWNAQGPPSPPTGGRNYPHKKALQNLGIPFVSRVMTARDSGLITDADASDYLGLKLRWFPALEVEIPSK